MVRAVLPYLPPLLALMLGLVDAVDFERRLLGR